jgi:hypothetical protein
MTSTTLFTRLRAIASFLSLESPYRNLVLSPVTPPRSQRLQTQVQPRDFRLTGPIQRFRGSR